MLIAISIIGFAIVIFRLAALRVVLVTSSKLLLQLNLMVEQIEGVATLGIPERAQAIVDDLAGKQL